MWINKRVIGFTLFITSIIVALISAAKLPSSGANWSNMFPLFLGAIILAVGGLLLLHSCSQTQGNKLKVALDPLVCAGIIELLQALVTEMQTLESEINHLERPEIINKIKILLDDYVLPLASAQQEIICLLGQHQGVEVLVTTSQGERLLNRMWSATCDGNMAEAIALYPKALATFKMALYSVT